MAKNMTTNKELIKSELNHHLALLRNAIAFNGNDKCSVYFAGLHKEVEALLEERGIKVEHKKNWGYYLHAPKKGTKAYKALFEGSNVLAEAKKLADAKVAAAKAEKAEKAAKAKEKAAAKAAKEKAAKEKAAAKAKKAAAKAAKPKTEKKVAAPKAAKPKTEKKAATPKAEKKVAKTASAKAAKPKTEKKAATPKAEKKVAKKAAPKAETKVEAPATTEVTA